MQGKNLKGLLNYFSRSQQTADSTEDPATDFEYLEKQTITQNNSQRLPSWQQFKQISRYLNPQEKKIIKICGLVAGISLVAILIGFYWTHTVLIPRTGGDYIEGLVGAPNYINPLLAQYNDVDRDLVRLLFNGLLKYDEQGALQLDLAKELQISANEKEYIFTLRDNVLWHDGEPFTADDIIFTIANIQDTDWQSSYRLAFTNIKVEKLEDYKVKFTLSEPSANFLSSLTVGILPEHLWLSVPSSNATLVELNKKPIGTGPFQFASLTKDKNGNIRTMVLERNESYYDQIPYLKTLTFKFYGDYETGVQALKNDNVDGLNLLPREYWEELEKNHSLTFHQLSLPQYVAVFFNTKKNDLLKDKALRQGLTYAVDYNKILNEALNEEGQLISGPILPGYLGYTEDLTKYDYNVALANELLDKTGWLKQDGATYRTKNGTELTVNLTTVANTEYQAVAEIIKSNWETIGVKTNLEIIPKDKIKSDIIEPRNYETLLFGQIIKSDPYPFWHSSQVASPGVNLSVWGNTDIDTALEKARTTTDSESRAALYVQFQQTLTENAPAIFLYNPIQIYPVTKKIKGLDTQHITSLADRFYNISNWYIKTKREFHWHKVAGEEN